MPKVVHAADLMTTRDIRNHKRSAARRNLFLGPMSAFLAHLTGHAYTAATNRPLTPSKGHQRHRSASVSSVYQRKEVSVASTPLSLGAQQLLWEQAQAEQRTNDYVSLWHSLLDERSRTLRAARRKAGQRRLDTRTVPTYHKSDKSHLKRQHMTTRTRRPAVVVPHYEDIPMAANDNPRVRTNTSVHMSERSEQVYAHRKERTYPGRNVSDPLRAVPAILSPDAVLAELRAA